MRVLLVLALALPALCREPALGPKVRLFNGKNLEGFDTYLREKGLNQDPGRVFRVEKGMLHISAVEFGYIITKQEYENYYLRCEFKWGAATHPPRLDKARDSGILYHVSGPNMVWPKSIEFQMIEGGTGDIILVGGERVTVRGATKDRGRFDRFDKGPWKDVVNYRDPNREVEKPLGQWNVLELWADGDTIRYHVNGILVNEGTNASARRGRILFQSEGAEVFFRKMELRALVK